MGIRWSTRRHPCLNVSSYVCVCVSIVGCLKMGLLACAWSLKWVSSCLTMGLKNRLDPVRGMSKAGTKLADGWRGVVWCLLGDHDYKRDCLGLPNVTSVNCCPLCPANKSSTPWFDFRKSAQWLKKLYAIGQVTYACLLFTIIGVTHLTIYGDWMHDRPLGTCKVPSPPLRSCLSSSSA
jgi:hypothetical protein